MLIKKLSYAENSELLSGIREKVFVLEQGVPRALEMDGQELESSHFLASSKINGSKIALGSARLLPTGQIGRMAVLKEFRGRGIGFKLLEFATEFGFRNGFSRVFLHAQKHAQDFYEKAGYVAYGDIFMEAGIEHIEMYKDRSMTE